METSYFINILFSYHSLFRIQFGKGGVLHINTLKSPQKSLLFTLPLTGAESLILTQIYLVGFLTEFTQCLIRPF
jgi:hypothetical protein